QSLPALLDYFPLFRVEDYASCLPEYMQRKGGVFIPMFQREALAILFESTPWPRHSDQSYEELYALRAFAGSVNALSGTECSKDDQANGEKYTVIPKQRRLDGFVNTGNTLKQFVAMPLGFGYTAE